MYMTETDARLHIYVCIRHKIFSFGPNSSGGAVCLHNAGYYADCSYSVILVNGNRNGFIPFMDNI